MPIITCQQRINNVIQILKSNYMLPIREFIGKEYVGRSGWMIGVVDDGTLILELYQLNSMLSEHGQTDSEHPQPQIIYVNCILTTVALWASIHDYYQLIGVDDPKQDWGKVTNVYNNGSVQLWLSDRVGIQI